MKKYFIKYIQILQIKQINKTVYRKKCPDNEKS